MAVDDRTLQLIALSRDEYELISTKLGRDPNEIELGMFGALWSEHCGYKNSKLLLRLFPTEGPRVLTRAGEENAGAIDVGDGLCVVMKIESHNHPSAIEPYQGAATGVGGIVRDIFAMGARPIALLDSLRFGPLTNARNRYLFSGVVGGIGGYGNCLGVPTVAGEVYFEDGYSGNPLVNAMCVGVARTGGLVRARAEGPGNLLMLVGAETGRDGIHGATFASVELDERAEERRPAVQVGNPFLEKLLMEACIELAEQHRDWIVGMQDLGAAGLTSATVECAARAGTGVRIDVARVPRREQGMTPYEVMLSESQERMLIIVKPQHADDVRRLFARWELQATVIGEVTDDHLVHVYDGEQEVACLPVDLLTTPPLYRRVGLRPEYLDQLTAFEPAVLPDLPDLPPAWLSIGGDGQTVHQGAARALLALLRSPTIASKRWIFRQYDHQVLTNTVIGPGGDAAVLRLKGTRRGIAVKTDGNGRYCFLDPYTGGVIAVAEAARNVVCTGAEPVAITDCLNFGSPEKPDVYYQLEQAIRGMSDACRALGTPVVSGNVSLYNETSGEAVYPTPVVGMLGVIDDIDRRCEAGFRETGDLVFLLTGDSGQREAVLAEPATTLGGSEYLKVVHGRIAGPIAIDLERERRVQQVCLRAIREGLLQSAHDCSDGGLAVALAESCVLGGIGLDAGAVRLEGRLDAAFFGEAQSRIVVSCRPGAVERLRALAQEYAVGLIPLGTVGGTRFRLTTHIDLPVSELIRAYEEGLPQALNPAPDAARQGAGAPRSAT